MGILIASSIDLEALDTLRGEHEAIRAFGAKVRSRPTSQNAEEERAIQGMVTMRSSHWRGDSHRALGLGCVTRLVRNGDRALCLVAKATSEPDVAE